jgi:hypothetical protein
LMIGEHETRNSSSRIDLAQASSLVASFHDLRVAVGPRASSAQGCGLR